MVQCRLLQFDLRQPGVSYAGDVDDLPMLMVIQGTAELNPFCEKKIIF